MKAIPSFIIVFMLANSVFAQQIQKIILTDSLILFNATVIHKQGLLFPKNLPVIKREFKFNRFTKIKNKENNSVSYFDLPLGIELTTGLDPDNVDYFTIYFDRDAILNTRLQRKIRIYSGTLTLLGHSISAMTSYEDIMGLIQKKGITIDTHVPKNIIQFDTPVGQYILLFWDHKDGRGMTISTVQASW